MVIRRATLSDADIIYQLLCKLEEKELDRKAFDEGYRYNFNSDKNHYLLAEMNGEVVGYLSCQGQMLLHHTGWVYEIQELYVDEAYRSHGIGKKLLEEIEQILGNETYDVLEVSSNVKRTRAHAFYLRNGFEQTHLKFVKKGNQNW